MQNHFQMPTLSSLFSNESNILHHLPLHHLSLFDAREPPLADEAGDAGHEEDKDGDAGDDDEWYLPIFSVLISGFLCLLPVGVGPGRHWNMVQTPYLPHNSILKHLNQIFHCVITSTCFKPNLGKLILF